MLLYQPLSSFALHWRKRKSPIRVTPNNEVNRTIAEVANPIKDDDILVVHSLYQSIVDCCIRDWIGKLNVAFGSSAAFHPDITPMSAYSGKAALRQGFNDH